MREASSINFRRSILYGIGTVAMLIRYILQSLHLMRSKLFDVQP
jgi:hypothetical protein